MGTGDDPPRRQAWRRDVVAMDFDEVSRAFGMKVDGLIGQDILREFDRVTIDFPWGRSC